MDSEAARARAEAILTAWNRRDYNAVADNVSPHVVLVDHIRGRKVEGPTGYVDRFKPTLEAFQDMQGETVTLIVEGNQVAHETVWRGRHTAPLKLSSGGTIEPTNQQVTVYLASHMEVDGDGTPTAIRMYAPLTTYLSSPTRLALAERNLSLGGHAVGRWRAWRRRLGRRGGAKAGSRSRRRSILCAVSPRRFGAVKIFRYLGDHRS